MSCTIAFLYDYQNTAGREEITKPLHEKKKKEKNNKEKNQKPQTNKHTKWLIPRNYLSKYAGGKKEKNIRTSHASICHYRNYNNL